MLSHAKLVDCVVEVLENLGLLCEAPGPVGVVVEREGVEVRVDVAANSGICVQVPCASHIIFPLVDGEIFVSQLKA